MHNGGPYFKDGKLYFSHVVQHGGANDEQLAEWLKNKVFLQAKKKVTKKFTPSTPTQKFAAWATGSMLGKKVEKDDVLKELPKRVGLFQLVREEQEQP